MVKLQVELRAVGTPFTGAFTHETALLASGSTARAAITGLVAGTGYHWQARTTDVNGNSSDWVAFGANLESDADFSVTASGNTAPVAPTAAGQFLADGVTALVSGGTTVESTIVIGGTLTDTDGNSVRLLLELRPLATPFSAPTHIGEFVPSGSAVTLLVSGLAASGWHWRIAVEDAEGSTSGFTTPGGSPDFTVNIAGNANPSAPTLTGQFEPPSAAIAIGGGTQGTTMLFKGTLVDADGAARLEIEVRPIGTAFTNVASAVSGFVASGTEASTALDGLVGDYHWQLRSADASGGFSAWTSFGGNTEAETDFTTAAAPPLVVIKTKNKGKLCGATEEGSPLAIASLVIVLGLLAMRHWR